MRDGGLLVLHLCVNTGFKDAILNGIRARSSACGRIAFRVLLVCFLR